MIRRDQTITIDCLPAGLGQKPVPSLQVEMPCQGGMTSLMLLQSPLTDFANLIAGYFAEIWDFLIFVGQLSAVIVVLAGAILWFTEVNASKGKGLVLSGILLSVVVTYFVLFPPAFVPG